MLKDHEGDLSDHLSLHIPNILHIPNVLHIPNRDLYFSQGYRVTLLQFCQ